MLQKEAYLNEKLRPWLPHFDKLENAERRNCSYLRYGVGQAFGI